VAVVDDPHAGPAPRRSASGGDLLPRHGRGLDHDATPSILERVPRVRAQVHQHLLELGRVGLDVQGRRGQLQPQLRARGQRRPKQAEGFLHDGLERDVLQLLRPAPAEGQDLPHQVARAQAGLLDLAEGGLCRMAGFQLGHGELDVAQDGAEDVVEVVRDAAGQGAERFHLLGLVQLRLEAAQLGLGLAVGRAARGLRQLALERRPEPPQVLLHHVVVGAGLHRGDRGLLADRPRDEDERDVHAGVAELGQRVEPAEARHAEVGNHRVPGAFEQRLAQRRQVLHAPAFRGEAGLAELPHGQPEVVLGILDREDLDRALVHDAVIAAAGPG